MPRINIVFMISALITTSIFFSSCEKEVASSKTIQPTLKSNARLSVVSAYNLITNTTDPDELFTNMKLYNWGTELKTQFTNQNVYNQVISDLVSDADHTMSFTSLGLSTVTPSFEFQGDTLIPYLWLYNGGRSIDEELNGYLCLSTEVDVETALGATYDPKDFEDNDDVIPGWLLSSTYPSHVISYDEAETLENAILIISYYSEGYEPNNTPVARKTEHIHPVDPAIGYKRYWAKSFNIDARHDNSKHSEVRFQYSLVIDNTFNYYYPLSTGTILIHKNDLNTWIDNSWGIYPLTGNYNNGSAEQIDDNSDVKIFGAVYEFDWYRITREPIHITSQIQSGNYVDYKLKMKNISDVYEYLCEEDLTYLSNGNYFIGNHIKIFQDK